MIASANNNNVIALAVGGDHSVVLHQDGTVWATGYSIFVTHDTLTLNFTSKPQALNLYANRDHKPDPNPGHNPDYNPDHNPGHNRL